MENGPTESEIALGSPKRRIETEAALWGTPQARDWKGKPGQGFNAGSLAEDVALWPTPKGSAENYGQPRENDRGDLQAAASLFPTPRSCSGLRSSGSNRTELVNAYSHQDPPTGTAGASSSEPRLTLNPRFVEALQGFPVGWTVCEPLVTRLYLSRLRRRLRSLFGESPDD